MPDCRLYENLENECCCICASRVPTSTPDDQHIGYVCLLEFFINPDHGIARFWQNGHGHCDFFIDKTDNRLEEKDSE